MYFFNEHSHLLRDKEKKFYRFKTNERINLQTIYNYTLQPYQDILLWSLGTTTLSITTFYIRYSG